MDRLRGMFGGQGDTPQSQNYAQTPQNDEEDEASSLINESTPSTSSGVFSKGQELMDKLETGPDYKIAGCFLIVSVLFFFAAVTALPFIIISPSSFNLYFCFGSIFLQMALAFFYAPMTYLRKLFSQENRVISTIYIVSLIVDLYFIWSGAGYLMTILLVGLQGCALTWFVTQALGGAERANNLAYAMVLSSVVSKLKGMVGGGDKGQADLPI